MDNEVDVSVEWVSLAELKNNELQYEHSGTVLGDQPAGGAYSHLHEDTSQVHTGLHERCHSSSSAPVFAAVACSFSNYCMWLAQHYCGVCAFH